MDAELLKHFESQLCALNRPDLKQKFAESGTELLQCSKSIAVHAAKFYEQYVFGCQHRVALCGINPGRLGAAKSGVPFVDASLLSELLGYDVGAGKERSAQFFKSIINHFGAVKFFANVYVTNISTFGFQKAGKNTNYYDLPTEIKEEILNWFSIEISLSEVAAIIPCSWHVYQTLVQLRKWGRFTATIHEPLPHPNWCAFPAKKEHALKLYTDKLSSFVS